MWGRWDQSSARLGTGSPDAGLVRFVGDLPTVFAGAKWPGAVGSGLAIDQRLYTNHRGYDLSPYSDSIGPPLGVGKRGCALFLEFGSPQVCESGGPQDHGYHGPSADLLSSFACYGTLGSGDELCSFERSLWVALVSVA